MNTTDKLLNSTEKTEFLETKIISVIYIYVSPCIIFIGTISNVLSILVLSRKAMRRSPTMFYLLILSCADLLVLYTGLLRYWIIKAFNVDIRKLHDLICKVHVFLVYFSLDFASWILVAVTIDRCVSVVIPLKAKMWCTKRRSKIVILIILIVLFLINIHLFFTVGLRTNEDGNVCQDLEEMSKFVNIIWPWIDFAVFCFVPFGIMIVANALIIRQIAASVRSFRKLTLSNGQGTNRGSIQLSSISSIENDRQMSISDSIVPIEYFAIKDGYITGTCNLSNNSKQHQAKAQVSTNVTIMLLTVNVVFFLCTTPIAVYFLGRHYWISNASTPRQRARLDLLYCIVNMLQYLNNSIHFFLYCFTGERFRAEFYELFSIIDKTSVSP